MSTEQLVVDCSELSKSFGTGEQRVLALRQVSLTVRKGELLMLVGPSGCGKTTLISVLAGTLGFDSGRVRVLGSDLAAFSDNERVRWRGRRIGFVFQQFNLIPTLTAAENVGVPLMIQGESSRRATERGRAVLAEVGLGSRADFFPSQLSGGQQQRVAIARALVHEPELIVCDEPTSALDATTGKQIMELFRDLIHRKGRTVVMVTHDSRIFPFADRIAKLTDGAIEGFLTSKEMTHEH